MARAGMHLEQGRAALAARLRERRADIEHATLTRVYSISDPTEVADPAYAEGLRTAVSIALDHGLSAIEGRSANLPVPPALLVQARLAARGGVSLDTVLRRYFAGYSILGDFLVQEGELLDKIELKAVLRSQAVLLDRLLDAVSEEYARESEFRVNSTEQRRADCARRILSGELVDVAELGYDFDAQHLGLLAFGPDAVQAVRGLGDALDRRLLLVQPEECTAWAWLGGGRKFDSGEIGSLLARSWPEQTAVAIGEPAEGLAGWRLSHRQAAAALPIALSGPQACVRYSDVALLATVLRDGLLAASLRHLYLKPLETERDGGKILRQALRAYLAAGRNVSSAAAALGIDRHTLTARLRMAEEKFGRPLDSCMPDLETALRLRELHLVVHHTG